ncbi:MAG TPA: hypothetical protein VNL14_16730 [Candidatus Acidoferrales bacterium]|nr:hypothetical protein [Candidatus Acidoferrales bacterium]
MAYTLDLVARVFITVDLQKHPGWERVKKYDTIDFREQKLRIVDIERPDPMHIKLWCEPATPTDPEPRWVIGLPYEYR